MYLWMTVLMLFYQSHSFSSRTPLPHTYTLSQTLSTSLHLSLLLSLPAKQLCEASSVLVGILVACHLAHSAFTAGYQAACSTAKGRAECQSFLAST